MSVGMLFE